MSTFRRDASPRVVYLEHQVDQGLPIRQRAGRHLREMVALAHASPRIVCLCGSTRFQELFELANKDESLAGRIVLSVGYYGHVVGMPDEATKRRLDELHLHKVSLADEVLLVSPKMADGLPYVGASTVRELAQAKRQGKATRWFSGEDRGYIELNPYVLHERRGNQLPNRGNQP